MSIKRRQARAANKHFAVLAELLGGFYEFLGKKPQPTTEEVRADFIRRERNWKQYCAKKQLNESAKTLFNSQVSQLWNRKKSQNESTEKSSQK